MLHLGFDAKRLFNNFTGLGNYSRTLLSNLAEHYPDQEYHLYSPKIKHHPTNEFFRISPAYNIHTAGRKPGAWWRSFGIKSALRKDKIDLFHGLSHEIPVGLANSGIKTVVTIHDLIIKTWPQTFSAINRAIYDRKFRYACQHADHIVAISESTKRDIIQYYGSPESKISVVYQTCGEQFKLIHKTSFLQEVQQRYQLPSEYLLYVGSIIERKNLLSLLQAIRLLPKTLQLPLVVVGKGKGTYVKKVKEFIQKKGMQQQVCFPKGITNKDLPAVYQKAKVFCYPSVYEGFGIPILEALYSRIPVVTSNLSSLPEAAGADAFYANPHQPESLAEQIELALTDSTQREKAIERGLLHAKQFDSKELTEKMMDVYRKICG